MIKRIASFIRSKFAKSKEPLTKVKKKRKKTSKSHHPKKFIGNPIISPNPDNAWESKAVFNPAAIYEDGKAHIVYRAIGDSDVSVLGYASSTDGLNMDARHEEPAYIPREAFEGADVTAKNRGSYNTTYMSGGGGYGGCEDPRMTKLDDRIYMMYVAYNGWSHPRVALTSIDLGDFLKHNWQWTPPVLISKPDIVDKNACLLPEKIDGKYVIFHRVFPDILIDFVDDLEFDGKTKWLKGEFKIKPRKRYWDSRKVGVGAPPIKTKYGWLLIYQGVGDKDPGRYKMGAMMLDIKDPTKVIARAKNPILEPDQHYENEGWKAGVAYPCGAVVIGDQLVVYYGGADKFVCVAHTKLSTFLDGLMNDKEPSLRRKKLSKKNSK